LPRWGRTFAPQVVDQRVDGDDLVRTQEEDCEQSALLAPADLEGPPVVERL